MHGVSMENGCANWNVSIDPEAGFPLQLLELCQNRFELAELLGVVATEEYD